MADDSFGTAEASGEREFLGGEFTLENVKSVVVSAGETVDGLVTIADCDEAAIERDFVSVGFTKHPPSNLATGCIGILSLVNEDKVELWEGKVVFKWKPNHISEVNFIGILG